MEGAFLGEPGTEPGWEAQAAQIEGPSSFVLSNFLLFKKGFGFEYWALLLITPWELWVQLSKELDGAEGPHHSHKANVREVHASYHCVQPTARGIHLGRERTVLLGVWTAVTPSSGERTLTVVRGCFRGQLSTSRVLATHPALG